MYEGREWGYLELVLKKETALFGGGSSLGRGHVGGVSKVSEGNWEKASAAGMQSMKGREV